MALGLIQHRQLLHCSCADEPNPSVVCPSALLHPLSCSVSPNSTVVVLPARQTLSINGSVTFSCTAEGGPSNIIQWSLGGANLMGENGTFLNVTNVDTTDGGTYTCTVRNQAGVGQDTAELFGEFH